MVELVVNDIPPKKHGEKSMWDNKTEAKRIVSLRKEFFNQFKTILRGYLQLEFTLYVPKKRLENIGDLDNFITGVCDALQKSHFRIKKFDGIFSKQENKNIHPEKRNFIENDSKILSIIAKKKITTKEKPYYTLVLNPIKEINYYSVS
ncbi:MAG: hypothetical protein ABIH65_03780 [Nanoarchaeota archaeon]